MICPGCRSEYADSFAYCPYCGEKSPSAPKGAGEKKPEPKTILVVDDDEDVIKLLRMKFQSEGNHRVIASLEGEQAVMIAHKKRTDAILLDIAMPGLNGFLVLEKLKQSRHTENIPVVVISSHADPEYEEKAGELGAAEYFSKPLDMKQLTRSVEGLLE